MGSPFLPLSFIFYFELLRRDVGGGYYKNYLDLFILLSFGELNNSNNLQNLAMPEMCSLPRPEKQKMSVVSNL